MYLIIPTNYEFVQIHEFINIINLLFTTNHIFKVMILANSYIRIYL